MSVAPKKTTAQLIAETDKIFKDADEKEKARFEEEYRTDIAAVEELLGEAKRTQSSADGYALRAIGWALHSIAIDLHRLVSEEK